MRFDSLSGFNRVPLLFHYFGWVSLSVDSFSFCCIPLSVDSFCLLGFGQVSLSVWFCLVTVSVDSFNLFLLGFAWSPLLLFEPISVMIGWVSLSFHFLYGFG